VGLIEINIRDIFVIIVIIVKETIHYTSIGYILCYIPFIIFKWHSTLFQIDFKNPILVTIYVIIIVQSKRTITGVNFILFELAPLTPIFNGEYKWSNPLQPEQHV